MNRFTTTILAAVAAAALLAGCASGGARQEQQTQNAAPATPAAAWSVKTRYHVDLWLHGYAMLWNDTTIVPYFKPGYRERMTALRNSQNVSTLLDRYRDRLAPPLNTAGAAIAGGQFLPLYYASWDDMEKAIQTFLEAQGEVAAVARPGQRGNVDQQAARDIAILRASFPTAADREWLRNFTAAVKDEGAKFYQNYWNQQERERAAVASSAQDTFAVYFPRFKGYLQNSQMGNGTIYLSLPLDGEGRTVTGGPLNNQLAVTFPSTPDSLVDMVYVFAHEAATAISTQAVQDNTTPVEKRNGVADRYGSAANVRGGALLLERIAPQLAAGYKRYYLSVARRPISGDLDAELARAFPLPDAILQGLRHQLDTVLGGI